MPKPDKPKLYVASERVAEIEAEIKRLEDELRTIEAGTWRYDQAQRRITQLDKELTDAIMFTLGNVARDL